MATTAAKPTASAAKPAKAKGAAHHTTLPSLTSGPLPLLQYRAHLSATLVSTITDRLGQTSRKALVLSSATTGRLLNQVVVTGTAGLSSMLNVTTFSDLHGHDTGSPNAIPLPGAGPGDRDSGAADSGAVDDVVLIVMGNIAKEVTAAVKWVQARAELVSSNSSSSAPSSNPFHNTESYTILVIPALTPATQSVLSAVTHLCSGIVALPIDLIPLDESLLSLTCPNFLLSTSNTSSDDSIVAVDGVAESLLVLMGVFGMPREFKSVGKVGRSVLEAVRTKVAQVGEGGGGVKDAAKETAKDAAKDPPKSSHDSPGIDTILLIDRSVDFVTPLLTPLTYEGLIDEVLSISNGAVKCGTNVTGVSEEEAAKEKAAAAAGGAQAIAPPKPQTILLNESSSLFSAIRSKHIEAVGPHLHATASNINSSYNKFRSNKDASVTEIHDFVKKIPMLTGQQKDLEMHINVAEYVKKYTTRMAFRSRWITERSILEGDGDLAKLEEMIGEEIDVYDVLRLLCLHSITSGGIKSAKYDSIRRDIVQTYGIKILPLLCNLEAMGAIKRQSIKAWVAAGGTDWNGFRRTFRLIVDNTDVSNPNDISYVSSGYAPLSVRLIQGMISNRSAVEAVVQVTECWFDETDNISFDDAVKRGPRAPNGDGKKVMLVYYLGGISYMEIAALRFLSDHPTFPYNIIIATTEIENGRSLLQHLS